MQKEWPAWSLFLPIMAELELRKCEVVLRAFESLEEKKILLSKIPLEDSKIRLTPPR